MSADGKYFAACSHHEGVVVIDVAANALAHHLADIPGKTIRFAPDSKSLAIGLSDGNAHVVSVPDFEVVTSMLERSGYVVTACSSGPAAHTGDG